MKKKAYVKPSKSTRGQPPCAINTEPPPAEMQRGGFLFREDERCGFARERIFVP